MIMIGLLAILGGLAWAKGNIVKTNTGYKVKHTNTYYASNVVWGDGYSDHIQDSPITGIAILAVGTGWTYSTITDKDGNFTVKVKADSPFTLRISDGNTWIDFEATIKGVAKGTTFKDIQ